MRVTRLYYPPPGTGIWMLSAFCFCEQCALSVSGCISVEIATRVGLG